MLISAIQTLVDEVEKAVTGITLRRRRRYRLMPAEALEFRLLLSSDGIDPETEDDEDDDYEDVDTDDDGDDDEFEFFEPPEFDEDVFESVGDSFDPSDDEANSDTPVTATQAESSVLTDADGSSAAATGQESVSAGSQPEGFGNPAAEIADDLTVMITAYPSEHRSSDDSRYRAELQGSVTYDAGTLKASEASVSETAPDAGNNASTTGDAPTDSGSAFEGDGFLDAQDVSRLATTIIHAGGLLTPGATGLRIDYSFAELEGCGGVVLSSVAIAPAGFHVPDAVVPASFVSPTVKMSAALGVTLFLTWIGLREQRRLSDRLVGKKPYEVASSQ